MLAHRLRRWPNIKPTLDQHLVFAGPTFAHAILSAGVCITQLFISVIS